MAEGAVSGSSSPTRSRRSRGTPRSSTSTSTAVTRANPALRADADCSAVVNDSRAVVSSPSSATAAAAPSDSRAAAGASPGIPPR